MNHFIVPICGSLNSTLINVDEFDVQGSARQSPDVNKSPTANRAATPSVDFKTSPNNGIGNEQPDGFLNDDLISSSPLLSNFLAMELNDQVDNVSQDNEEQEGTKDKTVGQQIEEKEGTKDEDLSQENAEKKG